MMNINRGTGAGEYPTLSDLLLNTEVAVKAGDFIFTADNGNSYQATEVQEDSAPVIANTSPVLYANLRLDVNKEIPETRYSYLNLTELTDNVDGEIKQFGIYLAANSGFAYQASPSQEGTSPPINNTSPQLYANYRGLDLTPYEVSYYINPGEGTTITKTGERTIVSMRSLGVRSLTLNGPSFTGGDTIEIVSNLITDGFTLTLNAGLFLLPDGTTDTAITRTGAGTTRLVQHGNGNFMLMSIDPLEV